MNGEQIAIVIRDKGSELSKEIRDARNKGIPLFLQGLDKKENQVMNTELNTTNLETRISLGECYCESGTENTLIIKSVAGGRHRGVIMVELGKNTVALNGERLVLAVQAALGKSFIGTTWRENQCRANDQTIKP